MRISEKQTFTRDVTVFTPIDGGFRKENLKAIFNYLDVDQVDQFDLKSKEGTTEFLKATIVKLDGLTDDGGQPIPYSEELRDRLFKLQHVRVALYTEFFESVSKAKAGN